MNNYAQTNILLHEKSKLGEIQTYLECKGKAYHQNEDEFNHIKEFHYFLGDSSVFIREFPNRANIKILSTNQFTLNNLKSNLENILKTIPQNS